MADFIGEAQQWLLAVTLAMPRLLAVFVVIPFFNQQVLPPVLRNSIVLTLTFAILPLVSQQVVYAGYDVYFYLFLVVKESLIGMLIGFLISMPFWALVSTGYLLDLQRGAMSAQQFNPMVGSMASPLGVFFIHMGAALLLVGGGFLAILEMMYTSYSLWPVTDMLPPINEATIVLFLNQFDGMMKLMLLFGAPMIMVMILTDIGMALIGRFVPQINVFLLSMPLKSVLAVLFLALYLKYIVIHLNTEFLSASKLIDLVTLLFQ